MIEAIIFFTLGIIFHAYIWPRFKKELNRKEVLVPALPLEAYRPEYWEAQPLPRYVERRAAEQKEIVRRRTFIPKALPTTKLQSMDEFIPKVGMTRRAYYAAMKKTTGADEKLAEVMLARVRDNNKPN